MSRRSRFSSSLRALISASRSANDLLIPATLRSVGLPASASAGCSSAAISAFSATTSGYLSLYSFRIRARSCFSRAKRTPGASSPAARAADPAPPSCFAASASRRSTTRIWLLMLRVSWAFSRSSVDRFGATCSGSWPRWRHLNELIRRSCSSSFTFVSSIS